MPEFWNKLISLENLHDAYLKAAKGKRQRQEVILFEVDMERQLYELREKLKSYSYQPGQFRTFTIYDKKPRIICAAPFVDRVVHHALMNVVEPILESVLTPHCYACRKGMGVHSAVNHYQQGARRFTYALKLDIASYFACIDRDLMQEQLGTLVDDASINWLFGQIITGAPKPDYAPLWPGADLVDAMQRSCGMPIGNLTSQHLANLYLNPIDLWLENDSRVPLWLRYVDDIVLLADSKAVLWQLKNELSARLAELRLSIHPSKCQVVPCRCGLEVLGYRVFPTHRRLARHNGYRFRRKLRTLSRRYARGEIDLDRVSASVAAWLGHSKHADALGLQTAILNEIYFSRGDLS